MPRIIVTTDPAEDLEPDVLYEEHVTLLDFESKHHADQLIERIGWAVGDAAHDAEGRFTFRRG